MSPQNNVASPQTHHPLQLTDDHAIYDDMVDGLEAFVFHVSCFVLFRNRLSLREFRFIESSFAAYAHAPKTTTKCCK